MVKAEANMKRMKQSDDKITSCSAGSLASDAVSLPDSVEVLVAGWEDNLSRIRTFTARAILTNESDYNEKVLDKEGKSSRKQVAHLELWRDGGKRRLDSDFDWKQGEANKVNYSHAFVDNLKPADKTETPEMRAMRYGTPRRITRELLSPEASYWYDVGSKQLTIQERGSAAPLEIGISWLGGGPDISNRSLRQFLADVGKVGMSFIAVDGGNGEYVIVGVRKVPLPDGGTEEGVTRIVVDANKGCSIKSVDRETNGVLRQRSEYRYELVGGAWILVYGSRRQTDPHGREWERVELTVDTESLKVNEPVNSQTLSVDGLNIEKGTLVTDVSKGAKYVYNDIPLARCRSKSKRQGRTWTPAFGISTQRDLPKPPVRGQATSFL